MLVQTYSPPFLNLHNPGPPGVFDELEELLFLLDELLVLFDELLFLLPEELEELDGLLVCFDVLWLVVPELLLLDVVLVFGPQPTSAIKMHDTRIRISIRFFFFIFSPFIFWLTKEIDYVKYKRHDQ